MPVAPISTAPSAAPERAPVDVAGGFDALLAARLPAAGALRSVSLGQMVDAMANGPSAPAVDVRPTGVPPAAGTDPWGVGLAADVVRPTVTDGAGAAVIQAGERYLGVPYKWGGTSASTGFDCSGFVQQVYADLGVSLPRVSVDQARAGTAVASMAQAQPGDLVFWAASGGRPNHIGIYAGDGQMLVAPRTGDVVRYQEISRTPHAIRRVIT